MKDSSAGAAIEVDGLSRSFNEVTAVDDVSFTVPGGLMTGFVGGNGAGKTTTMRMMMGLLAVHRGEVRWDGRPMTNVDRRQFGYMPEERGLYPKQKVLDQLVYLGELSGMKPGKGKAVVLDYLERFGLADRAGDQVQKLSLGNQQRVQIIAALMNEPIALVLDEPFSGLDPAALDATADILREHTARGKPVLFSSHQLDLVERLCDRLVILAKGKVITEGTVADLRGSGPQRYRLTLEGDIGWIRDVRGIHVYDVDGPSAIVEFSEDGAREALLRTALDRGRVLDFAKLVPALSEIYREVTS